MLNDDELLSFFNQNNFRLDPEEVQIIEMMWDPNEDNILVSFGDKSISLITFQGLDDQTFISKKFGC